MQYITTISQKGQIVVPKEIRDKLNLKPSDSLKVTLGGKNIIVEPLTPLDKFIGMFSVKKPITKKDIKDAYKKHSLNKLK